MSRRLHRCHTCTGMTRHDPAVCAACRRRGVSTTRGSITVTLVADTSGFAAPAMDALRRGDDLTEYLDTRSLRPMQPYPPRVEQTTAPAGRGGGGGS